MKKWLPGFAAFIFLFTITQIQYMPQHADPDWVKFVITFADPDW
ncbi:MULTISPECIES: hypothetical protein [Brevibacillus]|uniref:Uncharacterized protein n=1 Tax=Brevibacillus parabrevis TaxID=54914 RepID=A0A4Y3PSX3_BREPA|nr:MULTISPECIES: hypothetical protein [Brevibacillus]GEB33431.1 hypothetical protein BPA01_30110 [Brevibacillus parabrevis]